MAIEFTQARGYVRLLVSDVDETALVLSDAMVDGFLAVYGVAPTAAPAPLGAVRRAAADALDAIATSETLVAKYLRTADGVTTDGTKVADSLRKRSATLRQQADEADEADGITDDGFFGVVEFQPYGAWGEEAAEPPLLP